jgi:hypothetical protein
MGDGGKPQDPVALLRLALEAFRQCAPTDLAVAEQGDLIVEASRLLDQVGGELLRVVRCFDHAEGEALDGLNSLTQWLRYRCRMSAGSASEMVRLARRLEDLPQTAEALASGQIGMAHASHIARAAQQVGAESVRDAEQDLVQHARNLDPDRFRQVVKHFRYCVDPDGTLKDDNRADQESWVDCSQTMNGRWHLAGDLDAERGRRFSIALESLMRPTPSDDRNAGLRRADALVEMAHRLLSDGTLPSHNRVRPHLTVTSTLEALVGTIGAPAAEILGEPISIETLRRMACDCTLTRVILDGKSMPIDVGRAMRTIPPALRKVLELRDVRCRWPGCDCPARWADAHHLKSWIDGGETDPENLVLFCRRHHRKVHEEGWVVYWSEERELAVIPPTYRRRRWRRPVAA